MERRGDDPGEPQSYRARHDRGRYVAFLNDLLPEIERRGLGEQSGSRGKHQHAEDRGEQAVEERNAGHSGESDLAIEGQRRASGWGVLTRAPGLVTITEPQLPTPRSTWR